jgi:hypothetical protein
MSTEPIDDQASVLEQHQQIIELVGQLAARLYSVPMLTPQAEREQKVEAVLGSLQLLLEMFPPAGESDFRQALLRRYESFAQPEIESRDAWNRVFYELKIPRG